MKKMIALMIALLMFVGVIMIAVSCENGETPETTTKSETVDTDKTSAPTPTATTKSDPTVSTTEPTGEATTKDITTAATETTSGGGSAPSGDGYSKPDGYLDVDFGGRTFNFVTTADDDTDRHTDVEISFDSRSGGKVVQTAVYD